MSIVAVVENNIPIVNITVPTDGTLECNYVKNGENITCGDTLFTYHPKKMNSKETDDSLCAILSPTDGMISFPYPRTAGMSLKAKSLFMDIVPAKMQDSSMHAYGFLSESDRGKVTVGQTLRIPIDNDVLLGTVGAISPLPNDKGLYYFDIALSPKSEELIMDRNTLFYHKDLPAEIIIGNSRLIYKIFASFTNW
ncbi:HlyD family secretion protein [Pseudoprevotella muciniphila]|nr:HlyD family efflux transporter periplasmic adaptor subunit [Pseudoprevotella muciniphila]